MSNDKILNKVTKITSPAGQVGVTTLANYMAMLFADKGYLTAVIELNRYYSSTPYIQDNVELHKEKSLSVAIESNDEAKIIDSFIQSKHHDNLFTLSLRVNNEIHDLHKYGIGQIEKIIRISRGRFDKIFIDAPMNYLDNGFFASIHARPDQTFIVMDENIANWQALKKYDVFLSSIKTQYKKVHMVVNKHHGILKSEFYKEIAKDMGPLGFEDVITIPYMPEIIRSNNDGIILADQLAVRKKDRYLTDALDLMVKNIEKKPEVTKEKKNVFKNMFGKKKKDEKSSIEDTVAKEADSYDTQRSKLQESLKKMKTKKSKKTATTSVEE